MLLLLEISLSIDWNPSHRKKLVERGFSRYNKYIDASKRLHALDATLIFEKRWEGGV
jgi:hypothetical protein